MIYMKAKNQTNNGSFEFSGHLGDNPWTETPSLDKEIVIGANYCAVQADGHELERCWKILGVGFAAARVYTFVGDQAKTIILNW